MNESTKISNAEPAQDKASGHDWNLLMSIRQARRTGLPRTKLDVLGMADGGGGDGGDGGGGDGGDGGGGDDGGGDS